MGSLSEAQHLVDVIDELPVSGQDRNAGLRRQCRAWLGLGKRTAQSPRMRLVYVRGVDGMIILLATNLAIDQLSAAWGDEELKAILWAAAS